MRAWVDVDLGAVRRNAGRLQRTAGVPIVAMVKADGYGTGAVAVARELLTLGSGLWGFGVATLDEARELRDAGIDARILCCTPLLAGELADAQAMQVRPALHRAADIEGWRDMNGGAWHLAIDTGMSRAGVRWDAAHALAHVVERCAPEGVFTHFHSAERADGSREQQEQRFALALAALRAVLPAGVLEHRDNSAGIASRAANTTKTTNAVHTTSAAASERRGSPGALARPGIGLYGAFVTDALALEQVVHVRARVIDVREVQDGETVSYGATYTAHGMRRIATISIGHGDGYRQAFSGKGRVLVNGSSVPVAGVVSMDMTMLDVTDARCDVGDVVTLVGRDGDACLTTDDVARSGAISPYELLVGFALRAPRFYVGGST